MFKIFLLITSIFSFIFIDKQKIEGTGIKKIINIYFIILGGKIIEKNKIKIISAYNLLMYAPIGAYLSEKYKIPLIVTNFGEIFNLGGDASNYIRTVKFICESSNKLLAMSFHCANSYKLLGLSPKVDVIPYGVDINKFSPLNDKRKMLASLKINENEQIVLFVGRLIHDMVLHILLESITQILKKNKKIKFLIIGQKGELYDTALNFAKENARNIFVIQNVPFDLLPYYYAVATIVVVPTIGDRACGSLAAIEAMASGKPVIGSNVGGIPEIIIDGSVGKIIAPNDPTLLCNEILNLLGNEKKIAEMGVAARVRAEEFYNEDKNDERIINVFEKMISIS